MKSTLFIYGVPTGNSALTRRRNCASFTCPDRPLSATLARAYRRSHFRSVFRPRSRLARRLFDSQRLRRLIKREQTESVLF